MHPHPPLFRRLLPVSHHASHREPWGHAGEQQERATRHVAPRRPVGPGRRVQGGSRGFWPPLRVDREAHRGAGGERDVAERRGDLPPRKTRGLRGPLGAHVGDVRRHPGVNELNLQTRDGEWH